MITTLGRYPTLGEVIDYYTQESFLRLLLDVTRRRRVVMVVSQKKHWEPNWSRDEVVATTVDELRRSILKQIRDSVPNVALDERPDYYPAFHQAVWKGAQDDGANTITGGGADRAAHRDCVFEADPRTWRDAFQDVSTIVERFEHYGVPYLHKFSGHRSLHMIIPGDIMPQGYRGKSANKLAGLLLRWSSSQAHVLPLITRMPYSLNEDSGLVCLPIERGKLRSFRPWQANLHLVNVPDEAYNIWGTAADQEALTALIEEITAIDESPSPPTRMTLTIEHPRSTLAPYRKRMAEIGADGTIGEAWQHLRSPKPLPEPMLIAGLTAEEADARWLTAEAFLFHGERLTGAGFQALITQDEEYVCVSATDVLLRFADTIIPYAVAAVRDLDTYTPGGAMAAYLLTQSDPLREAVFTALLADQANTRYVRVTVACLTGALAGDWGRAMGLVAPLREDAGLPRADQAHLDKKLQALDTMSTLGGWNKREEAKKSHALAELGSDITDLLLVAATSPDRSFRRGIVGALAELADPRATDHLIGALVDDYTDVRRKAIVGLVRIGPPAIAPLIEAAGSDQTRIRRHAVQCLGQIGAPETKPTIIEALHDGEEIVRRQAIRALKVLATVDDLDTLRQFLREARPDNALAATEILEILGDPGTQMMRGLALEEGNAAAAYFIASHGDVRGRDILVAQLAGNDESRDAAVEFLRELRDERCVPYLVTRLRTLTDWGAGFIARELGQIGTEEAVAGMIEALDRDSRLVRRGAVRGLADAANPAAIVPLITLLEDPDGKTRKLAFDALVGFGKQAASAIEAALAETTPKQGRLRGLLIRLLDRANQS
ncbi:MAG: HEAT repeat domain-containing protein [Anaerolineae bacterium]|nr:HEAT repeat domain-containing protein [Anaerolineae bacterium]